MQQQEEALTDAPTKIPKNGRTRTPKSARTRDSLLEAAEALFIERGFDGVSINDVARRAAARKSLVFYYFRNKQDLFDSVLDRYYTAQAGALVPALNSEGNLRDRIHQGIDAYLGFVEKNPGYPRLIQREICSGSRNLEKILQYTKPLTLWGRQVFGDLLPEDGPRSLRHLFLSVFGMIINYYTYSAALGPLWNADPMAPAALAQRREHVHLVVDTLLDRFLERDSPARGETGTGP